MTPSDVARLDKEGWRRLLRDGFPVDAEVLAGHAYRGTSLGMPGVIDKLTWKTFQKAFLREPSGVVRGWNVRVEQGVAGTSVPMRDKRGTPITFGHFEVVPARGRGVPHGFDRGLLLDYGRGGNGVLDPVSRLRDPIVALREGDADLLFGWSYLEVAGRTVDTPSFFTLEREHSVEHVAPRPR